MKKGYLTLLVIAIAYHTAFAQLDFIYKISKENNKIVYDNTIKIFSGQKCIITATETNGKIEKFRLISKDNSDLKTMNDLTKKVKDISGKKIVKENQLFIELNTIFDNGTNTILIVNNPFGKPIIYKAKIFSKQSNAYEETSIYAVFPGTAGVETWPYKIDDIILYDFKFTK